MQECPRCGNQVRDGVKFCPSCGAGVAGSWTGRLRAGDILCERYTIVRPLARGGMGAVYIATDGRLGAAPVAVKEMTPRHAPGDTNAWEQAIEEFRREAALLARLSHPNLPHVIDQFNHNKAEFLVMELVPGHTLRAELTSREDPIELKQALEWFHQLASVLDYLHTQAPQIIYRDLKPTNIMVRPDGRLVLIDFGIARLYKPEKTSDTAIYGTPGYAPPEQYGLGQTDVRTDIYALAMVMHEVLTRFDPTTRQHARPPLAHTLREDIPKNISQALHQALDPDSDGRFNSISEFVAAIDQTAVAEAHETLIRTSAEQQTEDQAKQQQDFPTQTKRSWPLIAGAIGGIGLLVALVLFFWLNNKQDVIVGEATTTPNITETTEPTTIAENPTLTNTITETVTSLPEIIDYGSPPPGMVVIPDSTFILGSNETSDEQPEGQGYLPTFFIDRTEVSNAAYRTCVQAGACSDPQQIGTETHADYWTNEEFNDYPVVWVTWQQASDYCSWIGYRLPNEAEWEKAARGTEGNRWPWGNEWNAELIHIPAAGDPVPVDSLEAGASPYGILHMAGNVQEWTSSLDQSYPFNANDGRELPNREGPRIVRGEWESDNLEASTRSSNRDRALPNDASAEVGFRCATSTPYQIEGMDYIPAGRWELGSSEDQRTAWEREYGWRNLLQERPVTPLTTTSFFIDRYEVTNARYAEFVQATGHPIPRNPFNPDGLSVWNTDGTFPQDLADHPVVNVTWNDARAFCSWNGKRLPTEAEWERTAKGSDTRTWPWGEEWSSELANTADNGLESTTPVGSYPEPGPYGTHDLAGNVWEWTNSLYRPYPYDASDGRESTVASGARVLRGGSWLDPFQAAHVTGRNSLQPDLANVNVGFRCVQDIP